MAAKTIMIQGTGSNVGKSVLCTALCRILRQDGYRVAPFKAQNMALNSYVTADGLEIGRAQGVQAEAAGIEATVDMNPILIKPKQDMTAQVVVMGVPLADMSAREYRSDYLPGAVSLVSAALDRLKAAHDVIVLEGAGSPAEINLKDRDIVNMKAAELAGAPVLLVADIDRGGVFASLVGTMELLEPSERAWVAGFIINKFRGDLDLLRPGLDFLEARTDVPVLGVVPYLGHIRIEAEDSVVLSESTRRTAVQQIDGEIDIAVLGLPRMSNFTDFDPLQTEPGLNVRYVRSPAELGNPDAIIIPGTKNTVEDLMFVRQTGLGEALRARVREGTPVIGICGGYQMLGRQLLDPLHVEADEESMPGLGLLDVVTTFAQDKVTTRSRGEIAADTGPFAGLTGQPVEGYEIHMGRTVRGPGARGAIRIRQRAGSETDDHDGATSADGLVFGTYFHGLFDDPFFRRRWLNALRQRKGLAPLPEEPGPSMREIRERNFDLLAAAVRSSLDMDRLYRIIGLP